MGRQLRKGPLRVPDINPHSSVGDDLHEVEGQAPVQGSTSVSAAETAGIKGVVLNLGFQGCDQLVDFSSGKHWILPFFKSEDWQKMKSSFTFWFF
ncbi:hypothetical protein [uncultured Ruegeria sp.]|uniref:hypothetical protein n=1 Tax=uncultured Ruegeria sp. TaxID=259304 RepID=UPI0026374421|nr:hypothetical protein [uncultured Ruegeria sp.]